MTELLDDGRVKVDMGEPVLAGARVPTTLPPTQGDMVVAAPLEAAGSTWTVTAVSMGNPHAVVYSRDGKPIVVRSCSHPAVLLDGQRLVLNAAPLSSALLLAVCGS